AERLVRAREGPPQGANRYVQVRGCRGRRAPHRCTVCGFARAGTPSRSRRASGPTGTAEAPQAAGRPASTAAVTDAATTPSGPSTGSRTNGRSRTYLDLGLRLAVLVPARIVD